MNTAHLDLMQAERIGLFKKKRIAALAVPAVLLAYFVYIFFAFDIAGLASRAQPANAMTLASDMFSHKVHVTRSHRLGEVTVVDMGDGFEVRLLPDNAMVFGVPGYGTVEAQFDGTAVVTNFGDTPPDWVNACRTCVAMTTEGGRVTVTRSKTEIFNYFAGWELFWFTLDSPYHGHGISATLFGQQIDPTRSNISGAWTDFWQNAMWRHGDVVWAIGKTILMAFLGTFGGRDHCFAAGLLGGQTVHADHGASVWDAPGL